MHATFCELSAGGPEDVDVLQPRRQDYAYPLGDRLPCDSNGAQNI